MAKNKLPVYDICNIAGDADEFMIDRFGHYLEEHKDLHFPHKHSFYHLVYFSKGSGSHAVDFVRFQVVAGQLYFMVPGQVHTWNFKNAPDGFIINFSEKFIQELVAAARYLDRFHFFSGVAAEQVIHIPRAGQKDIVQLFEGILAEAAAAKRFSGDMIRALMIQLFISVDRYSVKQDSLHNNNYNSVVFKNFKQLVDIHYREKKLTKDYAALLYITPNHLNALTKDITGHPAGELIRDRILLEAKRMLINSEITIAAIADTLDFADNSYFSRFFKKYTGITPEVFRKQNITQ
ncbi:helix-turn-helix domain-containing protein [Ferruginibacter sp.]